MSVPRAPRERPAAPRFAPLDGGPRALCAPGPSTDDGRVSQNYHGPLNTRAVTGLALIETERRPDDYDTFEDLLYTAAVHGGWLAPNVSSHVDLGDAEIVIRVPRHID